MKLLIRSYCQCSVFQGSEIIFISVRCSELNENMSWKSERKNLFLSELVMDPLKLSGKNLAALNMRQKLAVLAEQSKGIDCKFKYWSCLKSQIWIPLRTCFYDVTRVTSVPCSNSCGQYAKIKKLNREPQHVRDNCLTGLAAVCAIKE